MKKLICILVALTLMLSLTSCFGFGGGDDNDGDGNKQDEKHPILNIMAVSEPTKVVTNSTQVYGTVTLNGVYTYTKGMINDRGATQYVYTQEFLNDVDSGAGAIILDEITTKTYSKEYVQGNGVRENSGAWNKDGEDFASEMGYLSLNITEDLVDKIKFKDNVFTGTVKAKNIEKVFGEGVVFENKDKNIASDVSLTIKTNGVVVEEILISFKLASIKDRPAANVEIKSVFDYEVQEITLVKK